ncbi:response regulator [Methylomonas sp. AM2-LC]|uniref:response regulator n=1 Tax=Methylomonas sp. AM2-LC TaxID=3153301 RepID=UPI003266FE92
MVNLDCLHKYRVLYVEDDIETREELEMMLRTKIQNLYVASNGKEGLALYKQYKPDIVITDIQMPVMNGLSMAADIKAINPDQAIVILSAYNDTEYLFRALQIGLQDYITKPISVAHLLDKLVKIVNQLSLKSEFDRQHKLLEHYKRLIDEKAIVAKISSNGLIDYVNNKFCQLSGYAEQELLGQEFLLDTEILNTEIQPETLFNLITTQGKWEGLVKKRHQCGDFYVVDLTMIAINTTDTDISDSEFIAMMFDRTDVYNSFKNTHRLTT